MKVLFVCKHNVARSQMAEAFYRKYSGNKHVKSAGYNPGKWLGKTLDETKSVKVCMDEVGINLRDKISKQIDERTVGWADKIIVFDSLKNDWPDFLRNSRKVEIWEIEDPGGRGLEVHRMDRDEIKEKVKEFIEKTSDF